ncbi:MULTISPECIES: type IV secretion system protein [unclassified Mesorhizobium]|uniref:virB8 family protein n=1 Tax=unclassified Mesorhizobium TaxID=325217 RepID=UPI000FCA0F18|nr:MULTISPECIES: type IV secretion system protein [unclassified Mesorhizobium]RUV97061.1 type VI secretion protein [Mesorhizobium sp. M1A.F.Ca.IN.020.04.1.1]RUW05051.1 type VI secretion protein [Mesorhizobium sp. M1A.F.Ca.IN.020.03.1.1]RWH25963.1 MAG: type VI secretion protein [Mesorhizobium sp.]RWH40250.1 MAG: type VI secretion protein [Mesorhizobium sp.]TIR60118.1 MAG: type VI secretion protein [Mesorhizobium sp.]
MADNEGALRSYFQDGDRWEYEIVKKAKRSRSLAWFVALLFGVITLLALAALVLLVPLKTFEPYIVEVDKNTGYIEVKTGLTKPLTLTETQAITQANVVRYIREREGYDPFAIEENFGVAALLSTGDAARELAEQYSAANRNNPTKVYGKNKRVLVDVKSVTFSNASTALVRFSTTEKSDTDSIVRHYISVVRYRYTDTPETNEWRFENPLGFQVYNYRRDQETVTPGDEG